MLERLQHNPCCVNVTIEPTDHTIEQEYLFGFSLFSERNPTVELERVTRAVFARVMKRK